MDQLFVVVVYDISNDRRRTRLHERLKDFGTPVQYSVFECIIDQKSFVRMKAMVRRTVKSKQDHVRYYILCERCRDKIVVIGRTEVTREKGLLVV
ncbi:MAG: CRISPR-associated endonuclease Cas2 [Anaerolineales bacterium]|nr:CRISPR-associated endonuclease Cas2 [Anaerolineales bacterium]